MEKVYVYSLRSMLSPSKVFSELPFAQRERDPQLQYNPMLHVALQSFIPPTPGRTSTSGGKHALGLETWQQQTGSNYWPKRLRL